ncbi:hypothetical protein K466DRAFT_504261 [Polyporus arcularius HHB13444]|uniref:Uncharacterized protein n=1 Tax=Polyporus arcularius HHB13444 TaxID=1314778 RepID=A0A5C3NV62_9APHY|nr:hypothetical protein K466DRAFT_504261 [Polyporus arcularius HHB13444]
MIIVDDNGWPQWVRQCFDFMEAKQLGSVFMRALEWWTVLERSYNWENGKGLSVAHRPEEVTEWLKVLRRNTAKSPSIKDEVAYAEKWWRWWGGLQPSWRPRGADGRPVVGGEGDWADLKKPGKNGLLIVLLTLTWWDDAATDATRSQWHAAVEDVSWVIVSMAKEARSGAGPMRCVSPPCSLLHIPHHLYRKRASTTDEASGSRPRPKRVRRS